MTEPVNCKKCLAVFRKLEAARSMEADNGDLDD